MTYKLDKALLFTIGSYYWFNKDV